MTQLSWKGSEVCNALFSDAAASRLYRRNEPEEWSADERLSELQAKVITVRRDDR